MCVVKFVEIKIDQNVDPLMIASPRRKCARRALCTASDPRERFPSSFSPSLLMSRNVALRSRDCDSFASLSSKVAALGIERINGRGNVLRASRFAWLFISLIAPFVRD